MVKDARAVLLMAKEQGELESSNRGKNSIQVTISILTGLHNIPNKKGIHLTPASAFLYL